MLENIIDLIRNKKYQEATENLESFLSSEDEAEYAYANYLMGVINTRYDNKEKKDYLAKKHLQENISSGYPMPYAFVLYADIIKDVNVALNYIQKGLQSFPTDERLWKKKLELSMEKTTVINEIINWGFTDYELLTATIKELVVKRDWEIIEEIISRIQNNCELGDDDNNYFELLKAYSLMFRLNPNYIKASNILEQVIVNDIDNNLEYAHYVAITYSLIRLGNIQGANKYFDRIPLNNSLRDLDEGPWFVVPLNLSIEYKEIFGYLIKEYSKDSFRKNKAKELYALYLYYPSVLYDVHRYRKTDLKVLQKSLDNQFNKVVAVALFEMYLYTKEYVAANKVLIVMLENDVDLDGELVSYEEIIEKVKDDQLPEVVGDILELVQSYGVLDLFDLNKYVSTIFKVYTKGLFVRKQYSYIVQLSEELSEGQIVKSGNAFECAYAYNELNNPKGEKIYGLLLEEEPLNSAILNNLGVINEERGNIEEAIKYFEKAIGIAPEDKICSANLLRLKRKQKEIEKELRRKRELDIKKIAKGISLKNLEQIGYTDKLIDKFRFVEGDMLRTVLLRDFKECAIAICAGQEKSATVMCGSMIEALLLASIQKANIDKYDIQEVSPKVNADKNIKKVTEMGLNELLYVADKERIIQKGNYHLSQYVRDYRNVVHPAKELRGKQDITKENALLMWKALKRVICDLLHE